MSSSLGRKEKKEGEGRKEKGRRKKIEALLIFASPVFAFAWSLR